MQGTSGGFSFIVCCDFKPRSCWFRSSLVELSLLPRAKYHREIRDQIHYKINVYCIHTVITDSLTCQIKKSCWPHSLCFYSVNHFNKLIYISCLRHWLKVLHETCYQLVKIKLILRLVFPLLCQLWNFAPLAHAWKWKCLNALLLCCFQQSQIAVQCCS